MMTDYEAKREAFTAAVDQVQKDRARIAAINQALPDVLEDARRQALREERAALKTETESLPDEIGELARLAALADLARLKAEIETGKAELAGLQEKQTALHAEVMAFLKTQTQENRDLANRPKEPGEVAAWAAKQAVAGAELDERGRPLAVAIGRLDAKIKGMESRVMQTYPAADVHNPLTWARPAHLYGEAWRKSSNG